MYWATVLTTKEMSGRVRVRYYREPANSRKVVGDASKEPLVAVRATLEARGVEAGLQETISNFVRRS